MTAEAEKGFKMTQLFEIFIKKLEKKTFLKLNNYVLLLNLSSAQDPKKSVNTIFENEFICFFYPFNKYYNKCFLPIICASTCKKLLMFSKGINYCQEQSNVKETAMPLIVAAIY